MSLRQSDSSEVRRLCAAVVPTLARLLHHMRALAFCATLAAARALPSSSSAKHNVLFGARLRQLFSLCFGAFFRRADARGAAGCAVLTDDQDILLGSMDPSGPMQKTRKLIIEKGAYFVNGFGASPPAPLPAFPRCLQRWSHASSAPCLLLQRRLLQRRLLQRSCRRPLTRRLRRSEHPDLLPIARRDHQRSLHAQHEGVRQRLRRDGVG